MEAFDKPDGPDDGAVDVSKSEMVRDAIVFQIKLVVDGIRDFILIPVSLIATVLSLVRPGRRPGSEFYEVVAFGRRTEKMINLFGAADRLQREEPEVGPDLDTFVDEVEAYVRREAQSGRFDSARSRIERSLGMRGRSGTATDADAPDDAAPGDGDGTDRNRGDG